jgi:SAM-dependent methyltransferase
MKLNTLEFVLMNNPLRAASQRYLETPLLIGGAGVLVGQRVLEIGCGRGVGVQILQSLGAKYVTGFDLDPAMIALAQQRPVGVDGTVQVFVGDAAAIAVPDHCFDVVVDYGIIHHIPEWQTALHEIARVLKPGGVFYFEDLFKGFVSAWPARVLFDHPQATQFSAEEFRQGLGRAGLSIKHWRQLGLWGVIGQAHKAIEARED